MSFVLFQHMKNNGSMWIHVFLTKSGKSPDPTQKKLYSRASTIYKKKSKRCIFVHSFESMYTCMMTVKKTVTKSSLYRCCYRYQVKSALFVILEKECGIPQLPVHQMEFKVA